VTSTSNLKKEQSEGEHFSFKIILVIAYDIFNHLKRVSIATLCPAYRAVASLSSYAGLTEKTEVFKSLIMSCSVPDSSGY
jgi:hypothetical protein